MTINRVSIIQPFPLSYRDKIVRIPGVQSVTHDNWFGGVYQDEKNFFPQFAIDPENQRQVFPELIVPDDQWDAFLKDRQGAIAGAARQAFWLEDRRPHADQDDDVRRASAWEFNLDGIYHGKRRRTTKPSSGSSGTISRSACPIDQGP